MQQDLRILQHELCFITFGHSVIWSSVRFFTLRVNITSMHLKTVTPKIGDQTKSDRNWEKRVNFIKSSHPRVSMGIISLLLMMLSGVLNLTFCSESSSIPYHDLIPLSLSLFLFSLSFIFCPLFKATQLKYHPTQFPAISTFSCDFSFHKRQKLFTLPVLLLCNIFKARSQFQI